MAMEGLLPTLLVLVHVYIQLLLKFTYYNTHFIGAEVIYSIKGDWRLRI